MYIFRKEFIVFKFRLEFVDNVTSIAYMKGIGND